MPKKYNTDSVLAESERISRVWLENPTFTLGEVTLLSFQSKIVDVRETREQLESLKMQVTGLVNQLEAKTNELASIRTRALSGFRAVFGPDSTQYEQAGGTRLSEIRRSPRKGGGDNGDSGQDA